jgi:hypothetical protein
VAGSDSQRSLERFEAGSKTVLDKKNAMIGLTAHKTKSHCKNFTEREVTHLALIFHELLSRDHEDGRATGQPQGVGSEAYLNGTSQGPTPEDARKDGHIRGRSK